MQSDIPMVTEFKTDMYAHIVASLDLEAGELYL